uniref:BRX domain-containing protein n=1 Tax=Arundo donax TaxID=35708 RepID=A0A0A9CXT4_ARUDO
MHACFHGGGGGRITKSVGIIRDLTNSMKALSLKVKAGGGGGSRARARQRPPEDEELQLQDKGAASASASAKIAPAQPQEEERDGGEKHEHCDKCCSPLDDGGGAGGEEGTASASDGEWAAEPEPGVLMTLASRGDGTNHLRRIRFSEEYFGDARAAQAWWADNCDRIVELYSVVVHSEHSAHGDEDDEDDPAAPVTPCQSEDDEHQRQDGSRDLEYSASCSASVSASGGSSSNFSGPSSGSGSANKVDSPILGLVTELNSNPRAAQARHSQTTGQVKLTEKDTCPSILQTKQN